MLSVEVSTVEIRNGTDMEAVGYLSYATLDMMFASLWKIVLLLALYFHIRQP